MIFGISIDTQIQKHMFPEFRTRRNRLPMKKKIQIDIHFFHEKVWISKIWFSQNLTIGRADKKYFMRDFPESAMDEYDFWHLHRYTNPKAYVSRVQNSTEPFANEKEDPNLYSFFFTKKSEYQASDSAKILL